MKNYRTAFIIVLAANLALVGVLAGFWWRSHRPVRAKIAAAPASNPVPDQQTSPSAVAPPPAAETPLSPIQLSPERLQSIGVKFGIVERKELEGHHSNDGHGRD